MGRWTILIDIFGTLLSFSIFYTPAALLISFNWFHFLPRVHVLWKLGFVQRGNDTNYDQEVTMYVQYRLTRGLIHHQLAS